MSESKLHETARSLARRFDEEGIPFVIAGALALAVHGRVRLTEDVDVLVRREDLERFKKQWLGRGYVEIAAGRKAIRDTQSGVRIDFLLSGDFPGDGLPKPVAFPDPALVPRAGEDLRVLPLDQLIELKLASGMTAPHRGQDLVDVIELIRVRSLPREHGEVLNEYVRAKYRELWALAQVHDDY